MRVKRNCSDNNDFLSQSEILTERFKVKGYNPIFLEKIVEEVEKIPRSKCLEEKAINATCESNPNEWGFITQFHSQYKEVESIFKDHWHILLLDKKLGPVIPQQPRFIYRRAPTYGDTIVKKILDLPTKPQSFWDKNGFFSCRRCKPCKEVKNLKRGLDRFSSPTNRQEFEIKQFITCNTTHVVYALRCPCGLLYIGRTKRQLKIRIGEHINNIRIGFTEHNVSLHFKKEHNQDPSGLEFWGIEHVETHWRGSHRVRELSKRETNWIFLTDVLTPKGLNIELDINCFISDT